MLLYSVLLLTSYWTYILAFTVSHLRPPKCHHTFLPYRPGPTSTQHTASHTTAAQPSPHNQRHAPGQTEIVKNKKKKRKQNVARRACFQQPGGGRNVTSAGWQVTLRDPMWHASSRSGVATLRTAIHLLLTYFVYSVVDARSYSLCPW